MPAAAAERPTLPQLRDYQRRAHAAIVTATQEPAAQLFLVMFSRQAGKNEVSAQAELALLTLGILRGGEGLKAAPTLKPQALISQRRLIERARQAGFKPGQFRVRGAIGGLRAEAGYRVALGRASWTFLSADPTADVAGHTANVLLEVDEAQDVDPETFQRRFRPMAATTAAPTAVYGTPWTEDDLLWQMREATPPENRFEVRWEEVAAQLPAYGDYVEAEIARLGPTHPLILSEYCLTPVPGAGRLFSPAQLANLQGDHAPLEEPAAADDYVAGLDVGGAPLDPEDPRSEHDSTVLTIARARWPAGGAAASEAHLEPVFIASWQGAPVELLQYDLLTILNLWRARVAIDATGLGRQLAAFLLRSLGEARAVPVVVNEHNKSALGFGLLAAANNHRLKLPARSHGDQWLELWTQARLARADYKPNKTLRWEVPAHEGHDDHLFSLALAVHAAAERPRLAARGRRPRP